MAKIPTHSLGQQQEPLRGVMTARQDSQTLVRNRPRPRPFWIAAALLLLAAVLLRVDWQLAFRELPLAHSPAIDEALHWEWAQALAEGRGSPERPYFRAPLYPWWLGALHAAGLGLDGLRWVGTALGLGSLLLLAGLGLRHLSRGAALWLLALGGLSGLLICSPPRPTLVP